MPNNSKPVEETGTYSAYFNKDNIEALEEIGISGLPPAKVIDRLTEKARQYERNRNDRLEKIKELEKNISELREKNEA